MDSSYQRQSHRSRADRSTLIEAQFSALDVATESGTSDMTEATRQCVQDTIIDRFLSALALHRGCVWQDLNCYYIVHVTLSLYIIMNGTKEFLLKMRHNY